MCRCHGLRLSVLNKETTYLILPVILVMGYAYFCTSVASKQGPRNNQFLELPDFKQIKCFRQNDRQTNVLKI